MKKRRSSPRPPNVTRGNGILEGWLARKRARHANALIPEDFRKERILDIGCGSHPHFLANTAFREKFAVDQIALSVEAAQQYGIQHTVFDLKEKCALPYESSFFHVVTLLAVVEHITTDVASSLFCEIRRVLCPGGLVILTTPARWTDRLLRIMARLHLVSPDEINEHVSAYTAASLRAALNEAGFPRANVQVGHFELWMNLWAAGRKP